MQAFTFDAMNRSKPAARAAIFDMDGVVTDTAGVHAEAWRQMFDAVLPQLTDGEARPFDPSDEYRRLATSAPAWRGGASAESGPWVLTYHGFDPSQEGTREALCTLGDGYLGTCGAAPECRGDLVQPSMPTE